MDSDAPFVFLDLVPWPYLVQLVGDEWWLWAWSDATKNFVSLRPVTVGELEAYRARALPADQAKLYLEHRGATR